MSRKIIVILGPTASGKSALAVKIAKKIGGEIISADSRQVYRGLDIGSGKITKKEMGGIPHHCIDIVSPKKIYTVVDFKKRADKAIEKIFAKNKTPIIVGGTGLYIQAVADNIVLPEVKPDWKLRKQLEKKTTEEMFRMLKKLDSRRAENIDAKNPRRLIRAIEIAKKLGKVPSLNLSMPMSRLNLDIGRIGIKLPDNVLSKNIEKRIKKMLKDGLVAETKKLKESGLSWKRIYEFGFEYKYPAMFLQGKIDKKEMLAKMLIENRQYAKRQMTWFKRDKRIKWISKKEQAEKMIKN
ncbi:TPA: tRNA (adenosine(37)-N6)-dimethylallyltransferase MiaA [Patescibacteria group bacterium]|nr:MAG: tRNA dimethylallyltransferase [Parcubacteria group bacterium GW2011_GWF2_40_10]KKR47057.1 MAG: tRNA dimethylallyltransferase [Parcubacteria group bacterium GW2011_GWA2_40_143]KKR59737.1 MAG: tRNA dimethylallyltransferase [Parcubacteria group bacterium GW2011_GWC2_40_31]KKR75004.1 MAG: tRNA dimethylallyltransferase [Parcubacteria group bacterium GW2011_GWB2_40_8]KKR77091.1 MAG: tRNA dimethylallyltransferase [Parcubacteria group bacterium GW2011_GWE2_40_8]KKR81720.1 MAG: tRNA dimethylall